MAFKEIKPGQRDWLSQINKTFFEVTKPYEETDAVTLLNGWTAGDHSPKLKKFPLPDGATLVVFQFEMKKSNMGPEFGDLAAIPDGYKPSLNFPIAGQVPVNYNGHIGGYLDIFSVPGKLDYRFWPNNGGVDGDAMKKQEVNVSGAICWI